MILETFKLCLVGDDGENVQSGLKALDSLARTMAPGEENAFAELITTVLPLIHNKPYNENAMDALSAIWYVQRAEVVVVALISQKHETWPTDYPEPQDDYPGMYEVDRLRSRRGHPWYVFHCLVGQVHSTSRQAHRCPSRPFGFCRACSLPSLRSGPQTTSTSW